MPSKAKKRKGKPSPSTRSTRFQSVKTGQPFVYNDSTADAFNYFTMKIEPSHLEIPRAMEPFLRARVPTFASELADILIGPKFWIVVYKLNDNNMDAYKTFFEPGTEAPSDNSCLYRFQPVWIENALDEDEGKTAISSSESSEEDEPAPMAPILSTHAAVATAPPTTQPSDGATVVASTSTSALPPASDPEPVINMETQSEPVVAPEAELAAGAAAAAAPRTRRQPRYTGVNFSKLDVVVPPMPDVQTVLYRPLQEKDSLKNMNPLKLQEQFRALGSPHLALRDIRCGGLAVDFAPNVSLDPFLGLNSLQGISVSASRPRTSSSCSGIITGVFWEIPEEDILLNITTSPPVPVTAVQRLAKPGQQSWVVKLTFDSLQVPEKAYLAGRSHRVKEYTERPLQCFKCGRFGHTARVCRSDLRCWTCGEAHESKDCGNRANPLCSSCGGAHPVDSRICPTRCFQQKIQQVQATQKVTFKTARTAVTKAARTYAAALKAPQPNQKSQATPQSQPNTPSFIPNVAHPRPPGTPPTAETLSVLFRALLTILSTALQSTDLTSALPQILALLQSVAPGTGQTLSCPAV